MSDKPQFKDLPEVHGQHTFEPRPRENAITKPRKFLDDPNGEELGRNPHESLGSIDDSPLPPLDPSLMPASIKMEAGVEGFKTEKDLRAVLAEYPGPLHVGTLSEADQKALVKLVGQMVEVGVLEEKDQLIANETPQMLYIVFPDALAYFDDVIRMQRILIARSSQQKEVIDRIMYGVLMQGDVFFGKDQFYEVRRFRDNNPLP